MNIFLIFFLLFSLLKIFIYRSSRCKIFNTKILYSVLVVGSNNIYVISTQWASGPVGQWASSPCKI